MEKVSKAKSEDKMKVPVNTYIKIHSFMRNKLNLYGDELIIFAYFYGYTKNGEVKFSGNIKSVANWIFKSENTARKTIDSLEKKGLINKRISIFSDGESIAKKLEITLNKVDCKEDDVEIVYSDDEIQKMTNYESLIYCKTIGVDNETTRSIRDVINYYINSHNAKSIKTKKIDKVTLYSKESLHKIIDNIISYEEIFGADENYMYTLIDDYMKDVVRFKEDGYEPTLMHFLSYKIFEIYVKRNL